MTFLSLFSAVAVIFASLLNFIFPPSEISVTEGNTATVTTPLGGGCDPWFYEHDGKYYYCYSVGDGVGVKCSDTLADLFYAQGRTVYKAPEGTDYSHDYWAPELHFINGKWYIYVCADDGENANHRMYVLSCDSPQGDYVMEGKIADSTDRWAIDGTVLEYKGELWFVWSGWEYVTDGSQNLYIAHMSNPAHIDGERVKISTPTYSWEKKGMPVNEGPAVLYNGDKVYIVYSASGSWTDDYCLGLLTLTGSPDSKNGWVKSPFPVLKKAETAYGPGHCSFVESGGVNYIVYHANLESGTGWNARSVRIQPFLFRCGLPVFGSPARVGAQIKIAQ